MFQTDVQLISYGMNNGHHCMFFTCQLAHGTVGSLVAHWLISLLTKAIWISAFVVIQWMKHTQKEQGDLVIRQFSHH